MANTQLTQTGAQVQADLNKIEGLPTPTVADSGKVVGVNSSGQYVLVNAGGGGGDTPPTTPTDAVIFYSKYPFSLRVYDGAKHWDGTLYYSYDHSIWDTWSGTTELNADLSDGYYKLYLRGIGNTYITGSSVTLSGRFVFGGEAIKCCGNLNNLLSYNTTPTMSDHAFATLFYNCGNVGFDVTLPATTLAYGCYYNMFNGCISLTTAPNLPATTLADNCYQQMFRGCISLTTAPSLPATTLAVNCYYQMFDGCTSLTTAPSLNATTLAGNCYQQMFRGCISLTTAPSLNATTLADSCYYQMFDGCTSLTTAPSLNATTLAGNCYYQMFRGCISLTTAPSLPATTLAKSCYDNMFNGCTSLTTPAKMAGGTTQATPNQNCCRAMYYGCTSLNIYSSASGHTAFYKAMTYSTSSSATNYQSTYSMFYNCYIDGTKSTTNYLTAGTQYYY